MDLVVGRQTQTCHQPASTIYGTNRKLHAKKTNIRSPVQALTTVRCFLLHNPHFTFFFRKLRPAHQFMNFVTPYDAQMRVQHNRQNPVWIAELKTISFDWILLCFVAEKHKFPENGVAACSMEMHFCISDSWKLQLILLEVQGRQELQAGTIFLWSSTMHHAPLSDKGSLFCLNSTWQYLIIVTLEYCVNFVCLILEEIHSALCIVLGGACWRRAKVRGEKNFEKRRGH